MNDSLALNVVFTIHNDLHLNNSLSFISSTIEKLFPFTSSLEVESELADGYYEIIYRIQQPVIWSDSSNNDFFERLSNLFRVCSDLNPRFTQFTSHKARA